MYGVVEIGGHQYKVVPGQVLDVDRLEVEGESLVDFDRVLFIGGENPQVGLPVVEGAKVKAKVIRHARDHKILVYKRAPGKWQRRRGHRQSFTAILITSIEDGNGHKVEIDPASKEAQKYLK